MNWFNVFYKAAEFERSSTDEINQLMKACLDLISENGEIAKLMKIFPGVLFQTTMRSDNFKTNGLKLVFGVRRQYANSVFTNLQEYITKNGVEVNGYIIDNYQLYRMEENKFIRAEGEFWFMFADRHGNKPFFESGQNIGHLIYVNLYQHLERELIWRKYKDIPEIMNAIYEYETLGNKQAFSNDLFESPEDRTKFIQQYNTVYYRKHPERFEDAFQKAMYELGKTLKNQPKTEYEYDLNMDPNVNGKGKFINFDLIKQAYQKYGEFNVCVRYHGGRIIYKASQIIKFLSADIDDMDSEEFHNQLNGIRDLFVA